jgi:hypothetical protein
MEAWDLYSKTSKGMPAQITDNQKSKILHEFGKRMITLPPDIWSKLDALDHTAVQDILQLLWDKHPEEALNYIKHNCYGSL